MIEWLENAIDFSNTLNASISASWLILVVIGLRFLLKKAPKWLNVALWGIVALRLLMPFSIESAFSLIPSAETVSEHVLQAESVPAEKPAYLEIITNPSFGNTVSVELDTSISAFQWEILEMNVIWFAGMAIMAIYTVGTYLSLRRKLRTAVILRDNIFQCETVHSPFVLGIIKPRIYLPYTIEGQNMAHVIAHEQAHIRRFDHWWKPLGFLLLTIHWFNPFVWVAYILLCRDIELACDEKVIAELGNEQRADYTQALVACAVNRRMIAACPLAFGEVGVKDRIKSIMNYRKPTFWIIVTAFMVCVVVAVCFLTDPNPSREFSMNGNNVSGLDPEAIVERIMDIEDIDNSNVYVNTGNFPIQVDSNFNWANSQTVTYFFWKNGKSQSSQLRIYPEEDKYFLTEPDAWPEQQEIFLLRHYLDAIKYLPQEAIRQMAPADQYIIQFVDGGIPSDYERVIQYSSMGIGDIGGWFIHLQIQPLHADGEGFHGNGDEVIELFYGESSKHVTKRFDLEPITKVDVQINLRNLHNGTDTLITDQKAIEAIVAFISQVEGVNPTSSKDYYGGSFEVQILFEDYAIFSIGFGDDESFNYGDFGDGYPARYALQGVTREEIIRFFSQYDSSGFDWGLTSYKFRAKILEIHDGYFLVESVEDSWKLNRADKIEVPIKHMSSSPEPQVGDILQIEYDGMIQETYPAQILNVYHIALEKTYTYSSKMDSLNEIARVYVETELGLDVTSCSIGSQLAVYRLEEKSLKVIDYEMYPVFCDDKIVAFATWALTYTGDPTVGCGAEFADAFWAEYSKNPECEVAIVYARNGAYLVREIEPPVLLHEMPVSYCESIENLEKFRDSIVYKSVEK